MVYMHRQIKYNFVNIIIIIKIVMDIQVYRRA